MDWRSGKTYNNGTVFDTWFIIEDLNMARESAFGAEPEQLRELLSFGLEDSNGDTDALTASLGAVLERPGGQIGRYKLLHVLGEGGMGIVYLAEQKQPIRRQVALKVIKPGMDSKRIVARFEAERQALALLDHSNIAHVHDAGTTESGRPYFVMEYVKGLSIIEHCDRNKLTIEERLNLFRQICLAVHHAHQKGIIHRDIKPSNILVSTEDDKATPKIIDFGVAKAIAQPLTERTLATEESQLLGTPEYMSPEQADMASEDIDTRSDIYSLGILLYVLLTSALPFDSDTLRTGGIERIRQVIRESDPKTPSTHLIKLGEEAKKVAENRRMEIATLAKKLHKELEWIPLKAMRKERAERYRSVSELADDIENYLNGAPLIAGPPSIIYRLKKFIRRNRALVTGIAAVLAVLLGGIVVSMLFAIRANQALNREAIAHAEAQAIADFLQNDLIAIANPMKSKGKEATIRSFLETLSENLNGKFEKQPLIEASLRDTLGGTYRSLGEHEAAEPHLERAVKLRQEYLGTEHPDTLNSMNRLAWLYLDQARYEKAAEFLETAVSISRRAHGEEHFWTLSFANALGCVYYDTGRYEEAEKLYLKGVETALQVLGGKNNVSLFMVGNLGGVYEAQGRYDEAKRRYLETLRLREGFWDDDNVWTLLYKGFLAGVYEKQKRYAEAERLYLDILSKQQRVLGEEHVYTLWSVEGLAHVYLGKDKYEQAEELFTQALQGLKKVRGEEHRDTIRCMNGLAELYTAQRQFDEAESLFTKAVQIGSRTLGDDHPWVLTSKNNLAVVYHEQAQYEKAETLLLEALEGRRHKLGDTHPNTIQSWNNLIALYESWNKPEKAKEWRTKLSQTETAEQ
ncbi:MAG: tetratricopeptide repeat protein [Sedimentisphaerales bacterium]|nr:tetratricopeptide repeat protein [Sedimentisphaerales bacterium]